MPISALLKTRRNANYEININGDALRAFRICSSDYLNNEIVHIKSSLTKLAYPVRVLKKAFVKAQQTLLNSGRKIKIN